MPGTREYGWKLFPGFRIDRVVEGLNMPVNLAFATHPDSKAIAYVTELYGAVKAFDRSWKAHTFADSLLNFEPHPEIPGEGESGVIRLCADPEGKGVFASMIYEDGDEVKSKVVRFHSQDGLKATQTDIVIDGIPSTKKVHQIQAVKSYDEFVTYVGDGPGAPCGLAFGPDGLYFTDLHEGVIYRVSPKEDYDFDAEADHVM